MQDNKPTNHSKIILYIAISLLLVAAVAFGTAYVLSRVSEPAPAEKASEVPLPQKLLELYKNSGEAKEGALLSNVIVQESGTSGYNNAYSRIVSANAGDGEVVYFYQTTDGNWHFFVATKDLDTVACSDYNTDDLINAFIGFTCWDTSTNASSFVAHPQPVFNVVDEQSGGGSGG